MGNECNIEKASKKEDSHVRLLALVNKFYGKIRDVFISSIASAKGQLNLVEIAALIEAGRLAEALSVAQQIPLSLGVQINLAFTETGNDTARVISAVIERSVFFKQTNSVAVEFMRENNLRLVREFTAEQTLATNDALITGIRNGDSPIKQARNFRNSIGLTEHQQQSVSNFRSMLERRDATALRRKLRDARFDPTIISSIENEVPLTKTQVNKMTQRYQERFIKFRAETIGRTEALRSVNAANNQAFVQVVDDGDMDEEELERSWFVTLDGRQRDSHFTMHNQKRGLRESFVTGKGNLLMFPGDSNGAAEEVINCRCSVTTRFKKGL